MTTNQIPESVPEQFESERLILRCPRPQEDVAKLNAALHASLTELKPWMPWAQSPFNLEQQMEALKQARQLYLDRTDFRILLFSKETDELVGSSGLHRIDWDARKFEIGYWVSTPHGGKGYITEAVARITQFCIEELQANRIEIRCDGNNVKSVAVAERLNFKLEGVLRKEKLDLKGQPRDTMVFAKVRGYEF